MAFLSYPLSIPLWLFILMLAAMVPFLMMLIGLFRRFRHGEIVKEEQSDMVVWKVRSQRRAAAPKQMTANINEQKKQEEKEYLTQVLKVLLKEGDKGVRPQTIADQIGIGSSKVQSAISKLIEREMVEEVAGMSGTRFYLTQAGVEYCRRKAR